MKTLYLGVGNTYRRDDGAGVYILRQIKTRLQRQAETGFSESHGEGTGLMNLWKPYDRVLIFDAIRARGEPGRHYHIVADREVIPADFFHYSSHQFGLAEAVELARILGDLPSSLEIFGVEGEDFAHGCKLSTAVKNSCEQLVNKILMGQYAALEGES